VVKLNAMSFACFSVMLETLVHQLQDLVERTKKLHLGSSQQEDDILALTQELSDLIVPSKLRLVIVIDEIDAFVQQKLSQTQLTTFLKTVLAPSFTKEGSVTVVGIANSIDVFEQQRKDLFSGLVLCENELKIIFTPYTRGQVV